MGDINPSLPIVGQPDSSEEPKVVTALSQLVAAINNLDTDNLSPTAGLLDGQFASPNNAVWRNLVSGNFFTNGGVAASLLIAYLNSATQGHPAIFIPDTAALAVAGKTTQLRVVYEAVTNATAPGVTYTFGLHPVTSVAGGVGTITVTPNATAVVGSTIALATPAASAGHSGASSPFTIPASGLHVLAVATNGTTAGNSYLVARMMLQVRHV